MALAEFAPGRNAGYRDHGALGQAPHDRGRVGAASMTPPSSEVVTLVIGELRWLSTALGSEPRALAALHSIARGVRARLA